MLQDFKKFLIKGNAIDMAVWFIFGAAFATFVKGFVAKIIMPIIGIVMWKINFDNLFYALDWNTYKTVEEAKKAWASVVEYGSVITDFINFVILGFIIFIMVRAISKIQKKEEAKPAPTPADIKLLEEIRDALKK